MLIHLILWASYFEPLRDVQSDFKSVQFFLHPVEYICIIGVMVILCLKTMIVWKWRAFYPSLPKSWVCVGTILYLRVTRIPRSLICQEHNHYHNYMMWKLRCILLSWYCQALCIFHFLIKSHFIEPLLHSFTLLSSSTDISSLCRKSNSSG